MRSATAICLLLLTACGGAQKITVLTDPPGATVTLTKIGIRTVTVDYGPRREYDGRVQATRYEDPPVVLGPSPLEYEFALEEREQAAGIEGNVTKQVKEGLVRAEKGGFRAERRVFFTGDPLRIEMKLEK